MTTDPVCGMTVEEKSVAGIADHAGNTYYFCSQHCLKKFQESPAKYVALDTPPATEVADGYPVHASRGTSGHARCVPKMRHGVGDCSAIACNVECHSIRLSDASRGGAQCARQLPDMRYGTGAKNW